MADARDHVRALVAAVDPFDQPTRQLRALQLDAAREAFAEFRERIPLLRTRADEVGVRTIMQVDDLVPLLFSHTNYKSYLISLIAGGHWDRLLRWYSTVSVVEPADIDLDGVQDVDGWTERLSSAGHRPYITSGTSGKVSFLNSTRDDLEFLRRIPRHVTCWPQPLAPEPVRRAYVLAPAAGPMRSIDGYRMRMSCTGAPRQ